MPRPRRKGSGPTKRRRSQPLRGMAWPRRLSSSTSLRTYYLRCSSTRTPARSRWRWHRGERHRRVKAPENVDFKRVDAHVHKLKGSSSSIGASRAKNACIAFRDFRQEENIPECLQCLQQPKQEFLLVKRKLETLFEAAGETSCSCRWVDPEDATRRLMVIAGHVLRKKRKNQHIEAITILLRLSMCNVSQL